MTNIIFVTCKYIDDMAMQNMITAHETDNFGLVNPSENLLSEGHWDRQ